jgi:hypothetical protein
VLRIGDVDRAVWSETNIAWFIQLGVYCRTTISGRDGCAASDRFNGARLLGVDT